MNNNDVLRRIRYIFDLNDKKMMSLSSSVNQKVTREQVSNWLKKDDDPAQVTMNDGQLAIFLNAFIDEKRDKKEGAARPPEKKLTNNLIFMKLKIALNLQAEDVLQILSRANFKLSKHELSAFFRKPGHKHYRECKDQILRNFLQGMQHKYRTSPSVSKAGAKPDNTKSESTQTKSTKPESAKPSSPYKWKKIDK